MNYFLAVEVKAQCTVAELCAALRPAFENGTAGDFQILHTSHLAYVVMFQRSATEDAEYVNNRLDAATSVERAAMYQLADELFDAGAEGFAMQIVELLREGDAQCFDFCNGAIESMAVYEPEAV